MSLTDSEIEATKVPYGKNQFKVSDGAGLYLLVKSSGRYWKLAYRYGGKQKTLAFGVYPAVTIEQARKKRDEAKLLLTENIDPGQVRKKERLDKRESEQAQNTTAIQTALCGESAASNLQQVTAIDQLKQQKIETRRLHILQTLGDSKSYSANERDLQHALDALHYNISFDRLRTDIAWLYEQEVVHIATDSVWMVYLTQSGLDVIQGRIWVPGIFRAETDLHKVL